MGSDVVQCGARRRNIFPPNIYKSSNLELGTIVGWSRETSQIQPRGVPCLPSARRRGVGGDHDDTLAVSPRWPGDPNPSRWLPHLWCWYTWIVLLFSNSGKSVHGRGSSLGDPGRVLRGSRRRQDRPGGDPTHAGSDVPGDRTAVVSQSASTHRSPRHGDRPTLPT